MKRIIFAIFLICVSFFSITFAAEPTVTSDVRTFNPFTGVYNLKGNVHVDLGERVIDADAAQVFMYKMEVYGQGNIHLFDKKDHISFYCDKVEVFGNKRTAYVVGNMCFKQDDLTILADKGSFNWKTKLAVFSGNVKVNGESKPTDITYNVRSKQFI